MRKSLRFSALFAMLMLFTASVFASPKSPIYFEENKGQWSAPVLFKSDIPSGHIFFERNSLLFSFYSSEDLERIHEEAHDSKSFQDLKKAEQQKVRCFAYRVSFNGSNPSLINGNGKQNEYSNYFIGNKSEKWAGHVSRFSQVNYQSLYNGIDLAFYGNDLNPEYDLILKPGADPSLIQMNYEGIENIKTENGNLIFDLGFMKITEAAPVAYQMIDGIKTNVECRFVLKNNAVSFEFPNGYDKNLPLVIDPVIVASTYSGSTVTTYGHSATFDDLGNIYSAGRCFGTGYPATVGAYDLSFAGSVDITISKYNPDGTNLLYATYIGGTTDEYAHSMFAHNGELYLYGSAGSTDYPTTAGAFDATHNGGTYDIIVSHFDASGSALLGSTYIGGSANDGSNTIYTHYGDPYRGEIIVDANGNALISSFTSSTDFPASSGAYDITQNGQQDGCVFKLTPTMNALTWATYIGGTGNDASFGIRLSPAGEVYVCGATSSSDFPATAGTYQTTYQGGTLDGFLLRFDGNGSALQASTFFGTADLDEAFLLDIDNAGDIYIYGEAHGGAPVTAGVFSVPNSMMFVTKFDPLLTNVLVSTVIGNGSNTTLAPSAFMVDVCKNIYLAGFGATTWFPTTSDAFYNTTVIGTCYLAALAPDMTSLLFGTFYGANHVDGGTSRFDPSGVVYHAVCQGGAGFPTQSNAWNTGISPPGWDVCVFKIDFEQIGIQAAALPSPASSGCAPFTVNFTNNSTGVNYIWDFGDSSPTDTTTAPSHTFNTPGTYNVMLVAIDSNACVTSDTAYITITVQNAITTNIGNDTVFCPPGTLQLDAGNAGATYQWSTGATTQTINVSNPGDYWVIVSLGSTCIATDTMTVSQFQFSGIGPDQEFCPGTSVLLSGNMPGVSYEWSTGETTSTISVSTAGTYWVEMNYGTCSSSDTVILDYSAGGEIFPPNVFTPNQDGVNDFYDLGNPNFDLYEVWVYDRWGIQVFYSNSPSLKWDGKFNDKKCPDGVYYWIVHYKDCAGKEAEDTGFVHLMR